GVAGVDTLYVAADDAGALRKYSLVGGNWTLNGTIGVATDAYRGLTGVVSGTTVTLYATRKFSSGTAGRQFVTLTDSSGYNGAFAGTPTLLATAGANTSFRGIAFAPESPSAANQPPVNTLPATFSTNEDTSVFLTGISLTDPDAGTANVQVTLS